MIGIAILGTGNISEQHIRAYQLFPERCEIRALYNPTYEKAITIKAKFSLDKACIYNSIAEMLKNPAIDLVSICTPPSVHAEHGLACLAAGKNVLLEKPMAASLAECELLRQGVQKSGKLLSVVSQNRYTPDNWQLHELIQSKIAGQLRFGQAESFWHRGDGYYERDWRGTWRHEGGGCTLNQAVHQIDLLNWMLGKPITVRAFISNLSHKNSETEDFSAALLTYENGAIVTLTSALTVHGEGQKLVFNCEKASLSVPFEIKSSKSRSDGFPENNLVCKTAIEDYANQLPMLHYTYHAGQIDNLLRAIENHTQPNETADDGFAALELVTAIYESAFFGKTVKLPLTTASPLFTKDGLLKNAIYFN